jgi:hypothetical protein
MLRLPLNALLDTRNISIHADCTDLALVHQEFQLLELLVQNLSATLDVFLPLPFQFHVAFRVTFLTLRPHSPSVSMVAVGGDDAGVEYDSDDALGTEEIVMSRVGFFEV